MGIEKLNTYEVGVNNDLSNALANIDVNRAGMDLTALEEAGGVVKVSIGSQIEAHGSAYVVETAAAVPTGSQAAGAYLFFDDTVPGFLWSATPGIYDPLRQGAYNVADQRQCRFMLLTTTTWAQLPAMEESMKVLFKNLEATSAGIDSIYRDVAVDALMTFNGMRNAQSPTQMAHPSGHNRKIDEAMTRNEVWDWLSPYIPNDEDAVEIHGWIWYQATSSFSIQFYGYAYKHSSTSMSLNGLGFIYSPGTGTFSINPTVYFAANGDTAPIINGYPHVRDILDLRL